MRNLEQSLVRPVSKPIEYATIEQRRRRSRLGRQSILRRVHGKHHVQVLDNLPSKPLIQLLSRVEMQALALRTLLARRHKSRIIIALKQARNFRISKKRVHPLQEARIQHIRLIHDEANLLSLERMNTLLANAEVPGLFEGDDYAALMTACKEGAQRHIPISIR